MSKGGKQNVIPTDVRNEVNQMIANGIAKQPCDAIGKLMDEAKSIADKKQRRKRLEDLDTSAKGCKCRNKGKRQENY